jgi:hypothetical protein
MNDFSVFRRFVDTHPGKWTVDGHQARENFWMGENLPELTRPVLLVWAIHQNWPSVVERCLDEGVDPNQTLSAVFDQDQDPQRWMLHQTDRFCPGVSHLTDWQSMPPLFHALNAGRWTMARKILAKGAWADVWDAEGYAVFDTICCRPGCGNDEGDGLDELLALGAELVKEGADPARSRLTLLKSNALFPAIQRGGCAEATMILAVCPALISHARLEQTPTGLIPATPVQVALRAFSHPRSDPHSTTRVDMVKLVATTAHAHAPETLVALWESSLEGLQETVRTHLAVVEKTRLEARLGGAIDAATALRQGRL